MRVGCFEFLEDLVFRGRDLGFVVFLEMGDEVGGFDGEDGEFVGFEALFGEGLELFG